VKRKETGPAEALGWPTKKLYTKTGHITSETAGYHFKTLALRLMIKRGFFFLFFFMYDSQHCFICHPSDSTVSEDARIEPRTIATTPLAVRRSRLMIDINRAD
jgi:hypothetical protein